MSEHALLICIVAVCAIAGVSFFAATLLDRITMINLRLTNVLPQRN